MKLILSHTDIDSGASEAQKAGLSTLTPLACFAGSLQQYRWAHLQGGVSLQGGSASGRSFQFSAFSELLCSALDRWVKTRVKG